MIDSNTEFELCEHWTIENPIICGEMGLDCCDCGGEGCGCSYCWSCNACEYCLNQDSE